MAVVFKQRGFVAEPPPNLTVDHYEWKEGHRPPVKPEVAAGVFLSIVARDRYVTPRAVVVESRPETAPLHPVFEWDDRAAADAYRDEQARLLMSHVVTVFQRDDTGEELPPQRMLVRVQPPKDEAEFGEMSPDLQEATEAKRYVPVQVVLAEPAGRRQLVAQALNSLTQWQRTYGHIAELAHLSAAIDAAKEQLRDAITDAAD